MARSVIQSKKECFLTGRTDNLHEHHSYGGRNRQISEKYGLKVWLTADVHNMTKNSVHQDADMDYALKARVQKIAMEYYNWSVDDFIRIIGRNYIEEE